MGEHPLKIVFRHSLDSLLTFFSLLIFNSKFWESVNCAKKSYATRVGAHKASTRLALDFYFFSDCNSSRQFKFYGIPISNLLLTGFAFISPQAIVALSFGEIVTRDILKTVP